MLIEESTTGDYSSQIWTILGSDFLPLQRRSTGWNMKFLTLSAMFCYAMTSERFADTRL